MDASLIDYARCHGLASPYLEIDPLCHVGHPRSNTLPDALSECDDRLSNARAALEERLRQEKLYVPVKASRVLASTIHEGQAERIKVEWVDILPHFQPFDNMKLEVPIFPIEYKKDALRYNCHDIGLQLSDLPRKIANSDPGATDSPDIHVTKTILFEKIRKEKLLCTKVSIPLMQSARDGGKTPVKELREGLDSLLEIIRTHHDDHSPPDLVPLSPTHFPPSPTLVSDEHMLPSPVASEIMGMDSVRTRSKPQILSCEEAAVDIETCPIVDTQQETTQQSSKHRSQPSPRKIVLSKSGESPPRDRKQGAMKKDHIPQKRRPDPPLGIEAHRRRPPPFVPRGSLGSLSSYMETRGKSTDDSMRVRSSYSTESVSSSSFPQRDTSTTAASQVAASQTHQIPDRARKKPSICPSHWHTMPQIPTQNEGLVFFLSTTLLKTHLRVIQVIEETENPPRLIYRDYTSSSISKHEPKYQRTAPPSTPVEADIIISPKTGIILTTAQAAMQLYLPGHKPASILLKWPKSVNSPLRERIFCLSSRYEQLYIFLSHGAKQSKNPMSQACTATKYLLSSVACLTAFCASLSKNTSIVPFLTPADPGSTVRWILALANKHACQLPPERSHAQYTNGFTPINPKPQLSAMLGDAAEGSWEIFLRHMGLNPFAAHAMMAILRKDRQADTSGSGKSVGSLSRFLEMSSEDRTVLFGGLLGGNVLRHIDSLIEKDWQCDWALDFGGVVD